MKYVFIVPVLLLSVLLTACSSANSTLEQPAEPPSGVSSPYLETSPADTGNLEDFVNAVNNHQLNDIVDLFNEDALLSVVNQVGIGPTLGSQNWVLTYNGKDQIKSWLKDVVDANLQIAPLSYQVTGQTASLEAFFYYPSQQMKTRLDTSSEQGRFKTMNLYIESIQQIFPDPDN